MHFLTRAIREGWCFPFVVPFMKPFSSSRTTEIYGIWMVRKSISVITMHRAHHPSQPRFTRFGSILRWCKLFTWWILIINNDNYWLMIWLIPFVSFREKCYGRLQAVSLFSVVEQNARHSNGHARDWWRETGSRVAPARVHCSHQIWRKIETARSLVLWLNCSLFWVSYI